jgi:tetratricopeptide (TPR) repeat protein
MKVLRITVALLMALALSATVSAQSRGKLRLAGKVLNEAGQPVEGADIRAAKKGEAEPQIQSTKTNKNGEWTLPGLAAGEWVIEAMKDGVGATVTETLTEDVASKTVTITFGKAAAPGAPAAGAPAAAPPPPDPAAEVNAEHNRALELAKSGKIAEARKIYEDLIVKHPSLFQLNAMLAAMYAEEGNAAKGLEHIKIALAKDPTNVEWLLLQAELMMETGDRVGGQKVLDAIDLTKVKQPRAFINSAIHKINSGDKVQAEQAVELLTKLIAQFPNDPLLLYLRGRAYIAATKLVEAKADLEKYVATAPATAPQMADAKKLLDQLNKK